MNLEAYHITSNANKRSDLLAHRAHYTSLNLTVMIFFLLGIIICNDSRDVI